VRQKRKAELPWPHAIKGADRTQRLGAPLLDRKAFQRLCPDAPGFLNLIPDTWTRTSPPRFHLVKCRDLTPSLFPKRALSPFRLFLRYYTRADKIGTIFSVYENSRFKTCPLYAQC
jgi:hypothetical protein